MRKLILIKHAKPLVDPQKSSELWRLSNEGREQAKTLAAPLLPHTRSPKSSPAKNPKPPKPPASSPLNSTSPLLPPPIFTSTTAPTSPTCAPANSISNIYELFFRRPGDLILGKESATQALTRFEQAIDQILTDHPDGNLAIVSHGTVIALFIEKHSDRNGFQIWREMSLPSFAIFDLPEMELSELQAAISKKTKCNRGGGVDKKRGEDQKKMVCCFI